MAETANPVAEIANRATGLFTRPTVAMELLRLADQPLLDAEQIKDCVAQDPALTCKILRVVNSPIYGLNRPVADLNQAIALLGIKPLKLLVLGFSLPDELFANVAAHEMRWYWTNTLTRAIAARLLTQQVWRQPSDEAFIAGMLQDIGVLVLLRDFGETYARFLAGVIAEHSQLLALEHDSMGFNHVQLSAALLSRWQLPARIVDAIAIPKHMARLARLKPPEGDLPQILHLADLLTQLVGEHRLEALPPLLEAGRVYRGMTKSTLSSLVTNLQQQVDQLAAALSLELNDNRDYEQTLVEAGRRMAELSEQVVAEQGHDDLASASLLQETDNLSGAVREFLLSSTKAAWNAKHGTQRLQTTTHTEQRLARAGAQDPAAAITFVRQLVKAANDCRANREELSLLIAEPNTNDIPNIEVENILRQTQLSLVASCDAHDFHNQTLLPLSARRTAIIFSACDRRTALSLAQTAIDHFSQAELATAGDRPHFASLHVGVATASAVPRNFDPLRMIERATRCLSAARVCGSSAVKSIEV